MRVVAVPCLKDNYAYLVVCEQSGRAAVVDPGEAAPVLAAVAREGVDLRAVWATHHHLDHIGGVEALRRGLPRLEVVGHCSDAERARIPGITREVSDGDEVVLGTVRAVIIHNPGHTSGAVSYCLPAEAAVFTGDTLFAAGCGRLFEGSPAQMHRSLQLLAALPADTAVYFGHEYTEANLRFAAEVEPGAPAIVARSAKVAAQRRQGLGTTPSLLRDELATNPFLRCAEPAVWDAARRRQPEVVEDAAEVFAVIRAWKDSFR
jgi:hydroxyacylglutathione hydrolase